MWCTETDPYNIYKYLSTSILNFALIFGDILALFLLREYARKAYFLDRLERKKREEARVM